MRPDLTFNEMIGDFYGFWAMGNQRALRDLVPASGALLWGAIDQHQFDDVRRNRIDQRLIRRTQSILSWDLSINRSEDSNLTWLVDDISYRSIQGRWSISVPTRLTLIWLRKSGRWLLVHKHESYDKQTDRLIADWAAASRSGIKPLPQNRDVGIAGDNLRTVVGSIVTGGPGGWRNGINQDIVTVFFPGKLKQDVAVESFDAYLANLGLSEASISSYYTGFDSSKSNGWLACQMVAKRADGQKIPLRGTFVARRIDSGWQVVHIHLSIPIRRQLTTSLLELKRLPSLLEDSNRE